jgi:arylsulfatase A-like enzyme
MNATSRPNLLFIFADQWRAHSCGSARDRDPVHTPRLDALARQSTSFTQCVSNYPVCSPYRAMLLSGLYPHRNTVVGNIRSIAPFDLRDDHTCVTDVLSQSGYNVGYLGKWHLTRPHAPFVPLTWIDPRGAAWNEYTPPHRRHGIDYWHGYNTYDLHLTPMYWIQDAARDQWVQVNQWGPEYEANVAIDYLRNTGDRFRQPGKPFTLFWSINPPHPPYEQVPDRYRKQYSDAGVDELLTRPNVQRDHAPARSAVRDHFAAITGVDEQIGRVLDELDRSGLADNTIVIVTADHGEMMGSHGLMQKNVCYEESMRVPMLMRWPGKVQAGVEDDLPWSTPDLPATMLGLLGLPVPSSWQGRDLAMAACGDRLGRPAHQLYLRNDAGVYGLRTDRYTLALESSPLLFDRREDPYQQHNLAIDRPELLRDIREQLLVVLTDIGDDAGAAIIRAGL